jgi:glutamate transport system permease protein
VIAVPFGFVFGIGRLSENAWIRRSAGAVVELFRAIPLLIMIFAVMFGGSAVFGLTVTPFTAVVIGLVLYNGSVLAEIVRAGILSIPRGQAEAALAVGLRRSQVMRMILLPQAVTVMMPAIVAQLVVLLKDTALGFIVSFEDLLNAGARVLPSNFNNIIPAVIVIAIIYIIINMAVGAIATWLEIRSRRSRKTTAQPIARPGSPTAVEGSLTGTTP